MRRLLPLGAILFALLACADARAQCVQPVPVAPAPTLLDQPRLACRACGWSVVALDAFIPVTAAILGKQETGPFGVMLGALTASSFSYSAGEWALFLMGGRTRPTEHWVALLAVRGAATALAFVAAKQLDMAGTVLATGMLVAATIVPVLVFDFDEEQ